MIDCIACGFSNPSSVGVVVCRKCGTKQPTERQDNKTDLASTATEQPETGNALDLSRAPSPPGGDRAKVWRWVAGIAFSIAIISLSWTWWVVASLSSSDSQAEQNGAAWSILIVGLFVVFPAVGTLQLGLVKVAITTRSKTERIAGWVAAAAVLVAVLLVVVPVVTT